MVRPGINVQQAVENTPATSNKHKNPLLDKLLMITISYKENASGWDKEE